MQPHLQHAIKRAGNGARTRDLKLGKLSLYQLSYSRVLMHHEIRECKSH